MRSFLWIILLVGGILLDIFLLKGAIEFVLLFLTVFWLTIIHSFKLSAKFSYLNAFFLLILTMLLLVIKNDLVFKSSPAERASTWAYIFLFIGLGQELFKKQKK